MIKYLGSKRLLIDPIVSAVGTLLPKGGSVLDLFSGTSRVGVALKQTGKYTVFANDSASYAYHIASCYIEADKRLYEKEATALIDDLNHVCPRNTAGHFTTNYAEKAQFFQVKNALQIESVREALEGVTSPLLKSIGLTSLMEAADRVDSTCGVQMAYLKHWASRSNNDLALRVPELLDGVGSATQLDAKDCIKEVVTDLTYIDPPYNQHAYLGNYHIWETLCLWDNPEVYGKARKRVDVKTRKSPFNFKRKAAAALAEVVDAVSSPRLLVSFNATGYITKAQILEMLRKNYKVRVASLDHKAYIGHKIGVYNPQGEKVGIEGKPTTTEYLFLCKRKKQC